jgi:phage-related protein
MNIIVLDSVKEFVDELESSVQADIKRLILSLEQYGHLLGMPYAKPIGNGLWELRLTGRPQIRILYGFHRGSAILLLALKKQSGALGQREIDLATKRFKAYCA